MLNHREVNLKGLVDYHKRSSEITAPFRIVISPYVLDFVFGFEQTSGKGDVFVQLIGGLDLRIQILLLKVECMVCRNDDQPDPLPLSWERINFLNRFSLGTFQPNNFRGTKTISAKLVFSWSSSALVASMLPPPPPPLVSPPSCVGFGSPNQGSAHAKFEGEKKELQIMGKVDFGDSKIDIQRTFSIAMPNEEPTVYIVKIVRAPHDSGQGQVQLRAVSLPETGETQLSELSIYELVLYMNFGQDICSQKYWYWEKRKLLEGTVYSILVDINIPPYGVHEVDVKLMMTLSAGTVFEAIPLTQPDANISIEKAAGDEEWLRIE